MGPRDFLLLAEQLFNGSSKDDKAEIRTAADRAYLSSALCMSEMLIKRYAIDVPRSSDFYSTLERSTMEVDPGLRRLLRTQREIGNKADYEIELDLDVIETRIAIRAARELMTIISQKF